MTSDGVSSAANGEPFSARGALQGGLTRNYLRISQFDTPFWGTRVAHGADQSLLNRCRALSTRMEGSAFFSHTTAAELLGIPLPISLAGSSVIHVAYAAGHRAPHAEHIIGHQLSVVDSQVITMQGLRISGPIRTWLDLASLLRLEDLVAAGDFIVSRRSPLASIADLASGIAAFRSRRGLRRLRQAVVLLHNNSWSPMESRLRTIIVTAGLPQPEVNMPVYLPNRTFVGTPDLSYPELKFAIEYEGDYHRAEKDRWRKDLSRVRRLEQAGWYVMRVTIDDLEHPIDLVSSIRHHLRRLAIG